MRTRVSPSVQGEQHEGRPCTERSHGASHGLAWLRAPQGCCHCLWSLSPFPALLLHAFTHNPMEGTGSWGSAGVFATAGDTHSYRAPHMLQRHMSHPQGTQGSPHCMAQAAAAPQSLFPVGLFPAAQEGSLFPFPLSAPHTGPSDTTHVRGLPALPVTHWVPRGSSMAQGVSTHTCAQTLTHVHIRGGC